MFALPPPLGPSKAAGVPPPSCNTTIDARVHVDGQSARGFCGEGQGHARADDLTAPAARDRSRRVYRQAAVGDLHLRRPLLVNPDVAPSRFCSRTGTACAGVLLTVTDFRQPGRLRDVSAEDGRPETTPHRPASSACAKDRLTPHPASLPVEDGLPRPHNGCGIVRSGNTIVQHSGLLERSASGVVGLSCLCSSLWRCAAATTQRLSRGPDPGCADPLHHHLQGAASNSALLLTVGEEDELVEVDGLVAGSAAAVPTPQDGLEEQHRLWECQAGRRAFGSRRSRVRKAWAAVTSAVWWCQPIQERPS